MTEARLVSTETAAQRARQSCLDKIIVVYEAATRLGYQSHFFARKNALSDDHLPFMAMGVPCADIIDINYGYNNVFHHTVQDTVDKLSVKSLDISGSVILETVRILDKMDPLPPK